MPEQNEGSGGLAGAGICTISTSDLIGLVDNLLTRVQNLEIILSQIVGQDVTAGTLSEITDQLGTVTNATLINAANGWVTEGTFSGVAISTLGWTLSTGETFPIVSFDSDGALNFGFTSDGQIVGNQANTWNTNSGGTFAMIYSSDIGSFTGNSGVANIPVSTGYDPSSLVTHISTGIFQVTQSGYYNMTLSLDQLFVSAAVASLATLEWGIASGNTNPTFTDPSSRIGPRLTYTSGGGSFTVRLNSAKMMYLRSGINHSFSANTTGVGSTFNFDNLTATLQLLKAG